MLFKGEAVPRQAARGLMWLTLASDAAAPQETWITELHAARVQAGERRRTGAGARLYRALDQGRREIRSHRLVALTRIFRSTLELARSTTPERGRMAFPSHAHVCRCRRRPDGRPPAVTAAGGRCGCRCSSASAGLIVPECVEPARFRADGADRVGQTEIAKRAEFRPGSAAGTARRLTQASGLRASAGAGMTL